MYRLLLIIFFTVFTSLSAYSEEFSELKKYIQTWSSGSGLKKAKEYIDKNKVTSQEVKELLSCFSFESTKLEFAKYAYHQVSDKRNYINVVGGELWLGSKHSLRDYINSEK